MDELVVQVLRQTVSSVDSKTVQAFAATAGIIVGLVGIRGMWTQGGVANELLSAWMTAAHKFVCTLPLDFATGDVTTQKQLQDLKTSLDRKQFRDALHSATNLATWVQHHQRVLRHKFLNDPQNETTWTSPTRFAAGFPTTKKPAAATDTYIVRSEPCRAFGELVYVQGQFFQVTWIGAHRPDTDSWMQLTPVDTCSDLMDNSACYEFTIDGRVCGRCEKFLVHNPTLRKDVNVIKVVKREDGEYVITDQGYGRLLQDAAADTSTGKNVTAYWPSDRDKILERLFISGADREATQLLECTRCVWSEIESMDKAVEAAWDQSKRVSTTNKDGYEALRAMADVGGFGDLMQQVPAPVLDVFADKMPRLPFANVIVKLVWKFWQVSESTGKKLQWLQQELNNRLRDGPSGSVDANSAAVTSEETAMAAEESARVDADAAMQVVPSEEEAAFRVYTTGPPRVNIESGTMYLGGPYEELVKYHYRQDANELKWPVTFQQGPPHSFTDGRGVKKQMDVTYVKSPECFRSYVTAGAVEELEAPFPQQNILTVTACGENDAVKVSGMNVPSDRWFTMDFPLSDLANRGSRPYYTREMQGQVVNGKRVVSIEPVVGGKVVFQDKDKTEDQINPPAPSLRASRFVPYTGMQIFAEDLGNRRFLSGGIVFRLLPFTNKRAGNSYELDGKQWRVMGVEGGRLKLCRFWMDEQANVLSGRPLEMLHKLRQLMYVPVVESRDVEIPGENAETSLPVVYATGDGSVLLGGTISGEDSNPANRRFYGRDDENEVRRVREQFRRAYFYDASNLVLSSMGLSEFGALDDDYVGPKFVKQLPAST